MFYPLWKGILPIIYFFRGKEIGHYFWLYYYIIYRMYQHFDYLLVMNDDFQQWKIFKQTINLLNIFIKYLMQIAQLSFVIPLMKNGSMSSVHIEHTFQITFKFSSYDFLRSHYIFIIVQWRRYNFWLFNNIKGLKQMGEVSIWNWCVFT